MCVNNLSNVALDSAAAGIEPATIQSQVQRPDHGATEPHKHVQDKNCLLASDKARYHYDDDIIPDRAWRRRIAGAAEEVTWSSDVISCRARSIAATEVVGRRVNDLIIPIPCRHVALLD